MNAGGDTKENGGAGGSWTHLDERGRARMVDVGEKPVTRRRAVAEAWVEMGEATFQAVRTGQAAKGDVFAAARLAGIMGAKRCSELIPLCHPVALDHVEVRFEEDAPRHRIRVVAEASATARTGVEMEALTAVAVAALTIYDMVKALERGIRLGPIRLLEKEGGRSGHWKAPEERTDG
jgi:cyclic pyranopterin phosphate synthase